MLQLCQLSIIGHHLSCYTVLEGCVLFSFVSRHIFVSRQILCRKNVRIDCKNMFTLSKRISFFKEEVKFQHWILNWLIRWILLQCIITNHNNIQCAGTNPYCLTTFLWFAQKLLITSWSYFLLNDFTIVGVLSFKYAVLKSIAWWLHLKYQSH